MQQATNYQIIRLLAVIVTVIVIVAATG